jgi:hypothetical protein
VTPLTSESPCTLEGGPFAADTKGISTYTAARGGYLLTTTGLSQLQTHYNPRNPRAARRVVELGISRRSESGLEGLKGWSPASALVTACNLREVLQAVPPSPFVMSTDEVTLARVADLKRDIATLAKTLPDGIEVCVTTAGNLVLDLIVRTADGEKLFWTPIPVELDFINPQIVSLLMESPYLLDEVIELVKSMGVVFNPKFYLSIEDFRLEYAAAAITAIDDLF